MAHGLDVRFRCRALFEVLGKTLSDISKEEAVPMGTLSEWKNDDREEFGGIWLKGCKSEKVDKASKQLREELRATSVYDEMKKSLTKYDGLNNDGKLLTSGMLDISSENQELQATIESDMIMLASVNADWFDSQLFKNSVLSSIVLNNQVTKDITKVKQSDIKASSEIHKMAKESRYGKTPDTVIFNANGEYSKEELSEMSIDEIEKLYMAEQKRLLSEKGFEHKDKHDT